MQWYLSQISTTHITVLNFYLSDGLPALSGKAKSFISAPYESARDRFLQENEDSSMDDFIADDDEEDDDDESSSPDDEAGSSDNGEEEQVFCAM